MDNEQKKYREVKKVLDILSYLWYNVFVRGQAWGVSTSLKGFVLKEEP